MIGVPLVENRGVPSFHEGIAMSRSGWCLGSMSSSVFGLCSSPGWVMTILKLPGSDSRAMNESGIVESDKARRWPGLLNVGPSRRECGRCDVGVEGTMLGVH